MTDRNKNNSGLGKSSFEGTIHRTFHTDSKKVQQIIQLQIRTPLFSPSTVNHSNTQMYFRKGQCTFRQAYKIEQEKFTCCHLYLSFGDNAQPMKNANIIIP